MRKKAGLATRAKASRKASEMPRKKRYEPGGTVRSWIEFVLGRDQGGAIPVPEWPPDLFAVVGTLLRRTGGYRRLLAGSRGKRGASSVERKALDHAAHVGREWRKALTKELTSKRADISSAVPQDLRRWWSVLVRNGLKGVSELADPVQAPKYPEEDPCVAALCLLVASDECSSDVGVVRQPTDLFLLLSQMVLEGEENQCRTLCMRVRADRVSVLPKQHTPQVGLTFRSLTHHLALCPGGEVESSWFGPFPSRGEPDVVNLLLLPWPVSVSSSDFSKVPVGPKATANYFSFDPKSETGLVLFSRRLEAALRTGTRDAGKIDVVVFPEGALSVQQYTRAEQISAKYGAMLVAGVRVKERESDSREPLNICATQIVGLFGPKSRLTSAAFETTRVLQSKHHRWCLDGSQIVQYGLGARLPANRRAWENIYIGPRAVNFFTISGWFTSCALICEDLARQEPAAEIVRSVGPSLVIALLMDGPQLRERWSSRYAASLADDPGCSVLSLTSLGMVRRSRRIGGEAGGSSSASGVFALWRDMFTGAREVGMPDGHDACVLTLVRRGEHEFTADGRPQGHESSYPVYAGHHSFNVGQA